MTLKGREEKEGWKLKQEGVWLHFVGEAGVSKQTGRRRPGGKQTRVRTVFKKKSQQGSEGTEESRQESENCREELVEG